MKKLTYILALIAISSICSATKIKIAPISINFKGVTVEGSTTVAYADFGSALISRDWLPKLGATKNVDGGSIVNVFIESSSMTAFNDRGEIAVSNDLGDN